MGEKKEKKGKEKKDKDKKKKGAELPKPDKLHGENWEEPRENMGLELIKDLSGSNHWTYPLWDDSRRSYAGFMKSPWPRDRCQTLFETIRDGTEWLQPSTA